MKQSRFLLVAGLIVFAVSMRLLPYVLQTLFGIPTTQNAALYPWNFSPATALCLFGGADLASRRAAYLLPLGTLLLSDLAIGLLMGDLRYAFYLVQPFVYACLALNILLGIWVQKRRSAWTVGTAALLAEILFFLITNAAQWDFSTRFPQTGMIVYPHTFAGLLECYAAALPFFKNSLFAMGIYSVVLFGGFALAERTIPALRPSLAPVAE
jgi:hypothetical protein